MYRRKRTLPPQEVLLTPSSKVVFSRNQAEESPVLIKNETDLKLRVSNAPDKILTSVCICIVMNTIEKLEIISNNLSYLQSFFDKSFIVFVVQPNSPVTEWCNRHENALSIETIFENEYEQRNLYLRFVQENRLKFEYMMVIDPIVSLLSKINSESFGFLRKAIEFNAMFANQTYKYYDIESLVDDKKQVYKIDNIDIKKKKIKQYQVHIPKNTGLIPVNSAFGGLAVYKTSVLDSENKYTLDNHISFNLNISMKYSKMFIDPAFLIETNPNNSFLYEK
jgi:hypothetical protein